MIITLSYLKVNSLKDINDSVFLTKCKKEWTLFIDNKLKRIIANDSTYY